jgi:hypothetical protein
MKSSLNSAEATDLTERFESLREADYLTNLIFLDKMPNLCINVGRFAGSSMHPMNNEWLM